jgi:hypothetical protein
MHLRLCHLVRNAKGVGMDFTAFTFTVCVSAIVTGVLQFLYGQSSFNSAVFIFVAVQRRSAMRP